MKVKKPAREREIRMIDEVTAADAEAIAALYN
jgi:hypothetical protein